MFDVEEGPFRALLTFFTFSRKRDLEVYARDAVVDSTAFAAMILACEQRILPFYHQSHFCDITSPHLEPTMERMAPVTTNGVGLLKPEARKAVRKMFQFFDERRCLAGHMFYTPGLHEWHFISFDQRDTERARRNHWRGGPHVHFINWLWPAVDPRKLWADFVDNNRRPSGLHLRYDNTPPAALRDTTD